MVKLSLRRERDVCSTHHPKRIVGAWITINIPRLTALKSCDHFSNNLILPSDRADHRSRWRHSVSHGYLLSPWRRSFQSQDREPNQADKGQRTQEASSD